MRKRILLVDDEEGYVAVLAKRLARREFDVKTALSGSEAIRILRNDSFDLAVLVPAHAPAAPPAKQDFGHSCGSHTHVYAYLCSHV